MQLYILKGSFGDYSEDHSSWIVGCFGNYESAVAHMNKAASSGRKIIENMSDGDEYIPEKHGFNPFDRGFYTDGTVVNYSVYAISCIDGTMDAVQELYLSLKEIVDAAFEGNGWSDIDPMFERQKQALKSFEKVTARHEKQKKD